MSPSRIEMALRAEVERATKQHEEAVRELRRVLNEIPSGLPHPDGTQRIKNYSRAQSVAMKAQYAALKRLDAFVLHGIMPEDLEQ